MKHGSKYLMGVFVGIIICYQYFQAYPNVVTNDIVVRHDSLIYLPGKDSVAWDTFRTKPIAYIPQGYVKLSEATEESLDTNLFVYEVKDTNQEATIETYTDGTYVKNIYNYKMFIPSTLRIDTVFKSSTVTIKPKRSFKLHGEFGANWGVGASYELKNKWEVGITYRPDNTVARLEIPIFTYD